MKITLNILKEDIVLDNYLNSDNCPITKALHRAGYNNLKDTGSIEGIINEKIIDISEDNNESYKQLLTKLFSMYAWFNTTFTNSSTGLDIIPINPESFEHTITL